MVPNLARCLLSHHGKAVSLYADDFTFEDVILQQRIADKRHLHTFFTNFVNTDLALGIHAFMPRATPAQQKCGTIQGRWKAPHAGDFMGFPAAGKQTVTRGMTL